MNDENIVPKLEDKEFAEYFLDQGKKLGVDEYQILMAYDATIKEIKSLEDDSEISISAELVGERFKYNINQNGLSPYCLMEGRELGLTYDQVSEVSELVMGDTNHFSLKLLEEVFDDVFKFYADSVMHENFGTRANLDYLVNTGSENLPQVNYRRLNIDN